MYHAYDVKKIVLLVKDVDCAVTPIIQFNWKDYHPGTDKQSAQACNEDLKHLFFFNHCKFQSVDTLGYTSI